MPHICVFSRSASRTPIAHLAFARSPPPPRFNAPFTQHIHALGRVMPGPACRLPSASDGSPPDCAVLRKLRKLRTASTQISTHGWYAFGCVLAAGSHFWFAPSYVNLVRTMPPACYQKLW